MSSEGTQISPGRPWLSPGTRLNGIYEIDRSIGMGGMGEIYKGHLVETNDPVAIKMMLPEMSANEAALTLFRKKLRLCTIFSTTLSFATTSLQSNPYCNDHTWRWSLSTARR